jgi:N-acetylglutamate synthase-like GNAT family acetyltransferase
VLAVDQQGRLAGCGQVKPHRDGTRELASIAVQPEMQGQGSGSAVVRELLKLHPPPLYLTCVASRVPFYRRFGFETLDLSEMPRYYRMLASGHSFFRRLFGWPEQLCVMRLD